MLGMVLIGLLVNGCQTGPKFSDLPPDNVGNRFHIGDLITVTCTSPTAEPSSIPQLHTERVREDGTITPSSLFGPIQAVGKTAGEVQREIAEAYKLFIEPEYNSYWRIPFLLCGRRH